MAADWLERHTNRAPRALRARVLEYTQALPDPPYPQMLAAAGSRALQRVLGHAGDRSIALDLLAADALVTLALLVQAETEPARLGEFAAAALGAGAPPA